MDSVVQNAISSGQPIPVTSLSQMITDKSKIYLYQGPTTVTEDQVSLEPSYLYYFINNELHQGAFYGNNITADSTLDDTSINPVQNRILTQLITTLQSQVAALQEQISGESSSGFGDYIIDSGTAQVVDIAKNSTKQYRFNFKESFQDKDISPIYITLSVGTAQNNTGYHDVEACLIHDSVSATGFTCYVCNGTGAVRSPRVTYIAVQKRVNSE